MAAILKRVICLANSRKRNGRCIAGKELWSGGRVGGWIRPVSDREDEEVSEEERHYEDGSEPRVLDVIDVPIVEARPKLYQRENWLLDPRYKWKRIRQIAPQELTEFAEPEEPLWESGFSTVDGHNDRIPLMLTESIDKSLRFIKVEDLRLLVYRPSGGSGRTGRRVQGQFSYAGTEYWLRVTDSAYESRYMRRVSGTYRIGESYLTVSLGEPYQGYAYKLIAAIIELTDPRSTR